MTKPTEQQLTLRERKKAIDDKLVKAMDLEVEANKLRDQADREYTILKVECDHKNDDGTSAWLHNTFGESHCEICRKRVSHKDL